MQHPSHYVQFRKEELVCKLIYSYGLKQSPHWNEKFCERIRMKLLKGPGVEQILVVRIKGRNLR